jgi:Nitrate reductase gamma subunit
MVCPSSVPNEEIKPKKRDPMQQMSVGLFAVWRSHHGPGHRSRGLRRRPPQPATYDEQRRQKATSMLKHAGNRDRRRDRRDPRPFRRFPGSGLGGGLGSHSGCPSASGDGGRRLRDPRIRLNSRKWDIAVVFMLWLQLALGLLTVPLSAFHMDGVLFETLTSYVKGVVTFNGGAAALMAGVPLPYKLHILLGFTIFLISPFTRMIHIWSGAGALAYLFRPYQIVRTPQTRAKEPIRS